ncbi:MAG: hypothetical protein AAF891_03445 [Pseudomonadota bacterium]
MKHIALISAVLASLSAPLLASEPTIVDVKAHATGMGWDFAVTIEHDDTGWDHFADGWEVVAEDGTVLGYRKLHHPHVDEQPFTRSLTNVMLPDGTRKVFIRVRCSLDGWKSEMHEVALSR